MNLRLLVFFFLFASAKCTAQTASPGIDTTSLKNILLKSTLDVHARFMLMNTINEGALKDDYTLAAGVGIGLTTPSFHGFEAGISSFAVNEIFSSALNEPDPQTLATNRYEAGMYDLQQLQKRNNLIRIENLFLKYTYQKIAVAFGKMKLNTPFINPQDGRMNATMEEGAWLTTILHKNIQIQGGWLWGISPRSTFSWMPVSQSFGIYPQGNNTSGAKAAYLNNTGCAGIAIANIALKASEKVTVNLWNVLAENVLNTAMIEVNLKNGKANRFYQSLMLIHQNTVKDGGNENPAKTYADKGAQANVISLQLGMKTKKLHTNLNATRITADGRYLMPREWGRDPFYTFMPREKNDGLGDVLAVTTNTTFFLPKQSLKASVGYGYFSLPDVKDYRLNKYGMPSYHQANVDVTYSCTGFFKGLDIRFLTAYKMRQGEAYSSPKFIYNKVNMANLNLVLDYKL